MIIKQGLAYVLPPKILPISFIKLPSYISQYCHLDDGVTIKALRYYDSFYGEPYYDSTCALSAIILSLTIILSSSYTNYVVMVGILLVRLFYPPLPTRV